MSAATLLCDLWLAGIHPRPTPDGCNLLLPVHKLTNLQRQSLKECKPEVLALLSDPLAQELMDAAMKVCDYWKDSPHARMQMRMDIWSTPQHLRAELLAHLKNEYRI
jgi:hypothetical protein